MENILFYSEKKERERQREKKSFFFILLMPSIDIQGKRKRMQLVPFIQCRHFKATVDVFFNTL
jgi:hypothetical protein